jgi:hypothetical protein
VCDLLYIGGPYGTHVVDCKRPELFTPTECGSSGLGGNGEILCKIRQYFDYIFWALSHNIDITVSKTIMGTMDFTVIKDITDFTQRSSK